MGFERILLGLPGATGQFESRSFDCSMNAILLIRRFADALQFPIA